MAGAPLPSPSPLESRRGAQAPEGGHEVDRTGHSRLVGTWVALCVLCGLLFFLRLGSYEFLSPDEPRFALISHQMIQDGRIIVPHLQGKVYSNKPPLYLWLVFLFSLPAGQVTEWSARLPSALAATGCVLLTFHLGRRFLGTGPGWAGALILMTSGHFLMRSRWASTDMTLAFFFTLSMVFLLHALHGGSPGAVQRGAGRWFFVAMALATLTKGPVGLALPLGILVLHLVAERRARDLLQVPWFTGLGTYLLLVCPWYILYGLQAGGERFSTLVIRENLTRYLHAWNNVQPFYFYLSRFPLSFLPWSAFLPPVFLSLLPAVLVSRCRLPRENGAGLRLLFLWFLSLFLFFSISSGKRTVYLLPLFPAAALLTGWFFTHGWRKQGRGLLLWARGGALALALLFLAGGLAGPGLAARSYEKAWQPALGVGLVLALSSLPLAYTGWRLRMKGILGSAAAAIVLAAVLADLQVLPLLDGYQNVGTFSRQIRARVPPGARFATARKKRDALLFYTGLSGPEIENDADLSRFLASPGPAYCVLPEPDWVRPAGQGKVSGSILLRAPVSHYNYVLVSNEVNHAPGSSTNQP